MDTKVTGPSGIESKRKWPASSVTAVSSSVEPARRGSISRVSAWETTLLPSARNKLTDDRAAGAESDFHQDDTVAGGDASAGVAQGGINGRDPEFADRQIVEEELTGGISRCRGVDRHPEGRGFPPGSDFSPGTGTASFWTTVPRTEPFPLKRGDRDVGVSNQVSVPEPVPALLVFPGTVDRAEVVGTNGELVRPRCRRVRWRVRLPPRPGLWALRVQYPDQNPAQHRGQAGRSGSGGTRQ